MNLPVILRRKAKSEFAAAAKWYERQQPGLGERFVTAVKQVLRRIGNNPFLHGSVKDDIRRAWSIYFPIWFFTESSQSESLSSQSYTASATHRSGNREPDAG